MQAAPDPRRVRRTAGAALFQLGLALAIAHVTVSLEIGVTLSRHGSLVKSLVLLMYPVAVALLGVGAALDRIVLRSDDPQPPMRASGVLLVLFLFVALRINFLSGEAIDQVAAAVSHVAILGAWFVCAGVALARLVRTARKAGATSTGRMWAIHQVGLVVGYLLQEALIPRVGANALHLVMGLSLLVPARMGLPVLLAGCLLAPPLDLDRRIDDLRDLSAIAIQDHKVRGDRVLQKVADADHIPFRYRGWSRLGQFELVEAGRGDKVQLGGWYNYQPQWNLILGSGQRRQHSSELQETRARLYAMLPPDGRVAFVGVGGGRGLQVVPHLSPRYLAIERDPQVVRYFTEVAPADNHEVFQKVTVIAGDARQVLERQVEPLDAIVFESARYQPAHSLLPASAPYYLYTRQSIASALARLTPDGWLAVGFTEVRPRAGSEYLALQVMAAMREAGAQTQAWISGENAHIHIIGCRSDRCMERFLASPFGQQEVWQPTSTGARAHTYRLTDMTPFGAWATMRQPDRAGLLGAVGAVGLACAGWAVWLARRRDSGSGWNPVPYFLSIGLAQSVFAVATCFLWRSYWQDEVLTVVRVLTWLIVFGAVGSALSPRIPLRRLPVAARVFGTVAVLSLHFLATRCIPFSHPSLLARELIAPLLLAPGGILMGVWFPVGIAHARTRQVGRVLLADAVGALAGYVVLYLVALPFGLPAFAASAVLAYAIAALCLPRGGPATAG